MSAPDAERAAGLYFSNRRSHAFDRHAAAVRAADATLVAAAQSAFDARRKAMDVADREYADALEQARAEADMLRGEIAEGKR